jgi:hypothetical protein
MYLFKNQRNKSSLLTISLQFRIEPNVVNLRMGYKKSHWESLQKYYFRIVIKRIIRDEQSNGGCKYSHNK